jgi:hypothetical protein
MYHMMLTLMLPIFSYTIIYDCFAACFKKLRPLWQKNVSIQRAIAHTRYELHIREYGHLVGGMFVSCVLMKTLCREMVIYIYIHMDIVHCD